MSLRTTLKSLIRRSPATSLRERANAVRDAIPDQGRRAVAANKAAQPAPDCAEYRARLLAAHAEHCARQPISNTAEFGSVEERASNLVGQRLWATAREVLALPPPTTADGLALTALAAAILTEADHTGDDPTSTAAVSLTRAVLAFTGGELPKGFIGFGDEPDHEERDRACYTAAGSLPAWALAQAQAECDAEDAQDGAPDPAKGSGALEEAAQVDFAAYTFDFPVKAPQEWAAAFAEYAMAMHAADRTLRMTKPELITFIRDAGGKDASLPGVMLQMLDAAQNTFAGWSKLMSLASTRYLVAASAATLSDDEPIAERP